MSNITTGNYDIQFYKWQREFLSNPTKFKVGVIGRRSGKSMMCRRYTNHLMSKNPDYKVLWISPNGSQLQEQFKYFIKETHPSQIKQHEDYKNKKKITRRYNLIEFTNGSIIQFMLGSRSKSVKGSYWDVCIIDEAGSHEYKDISVWEDDISPTLGDKPSAHLIAIGTPDIGKDGLLWYLYNQSLKYPEDYYSTTLSTLEASEDKYIRNYVNKRRVTMPRASFQSQYEAQFIDSDYSVFKGEDIDKCVSQLRDLEDPIRSHKYIMGFDHARLNDYSVITVIDITTIPYHIVYLGRWNQTSLNFQVRKLSAVADMYKPVILVIDGNSEAGALLEDYMGEQDVYLPDMEFNPLSPKTKTVVIENLILMMETHALTIPDPITNEKTAPLIRELENYQKEASKDGRTMKYHHPRGEHDDMVMSLALAASRIRDYKPSTAFQCTSIPIEDEFDSHITKCNICEEVILYTGYLSDIHDITCRDCKKIPNKKTQKDILLEELRNDNTAVYE